MKLSLKGHVILNFVMGGVMLYVAIHHFTNASSFKNGGFWGFVWLALALYMLGSAILALIDLRRLK